MNLYLLVLDDKGQILGIPKTQTEALLCGLAFRQNTGRMAHLDSADADAADAALQIGEAVAEEGKPCAALPSAALPYTYWSDAVETLGHDLALALARYGHRRFQLNN